MSAALVRFPEEEIAEADETLESRQFLGIVLAKATAIVMRRFGISEADASTLLHMSKSTFYRRMKGEPIRQRIFHMEMLLLADALQRDDTQPSARRLRWRDLTR